MTVSLSSHLNHTSEVDQKPIHDVEYLRWREAVAVALLKAGMNEEHELWVSCSDPAGFFVPDFSGDLPSSVVGVNVCSHDPHHQATAVCPTCQLRFCPDCCHRQAARLLARYMPFLKGLVADSDDVAAVRHIVLTTPIDLRHTDCAAQTDDLCKKVVLVFDALLGAGWRSEYGLLFAYEFGEHGHKLHFHCLAYCPYIDQADIVDAWREVTGGLCEVAFIRLVTEEPERGQTLEGAVAEVLKYASKLFKRNKDGEVVCLEPSLVPLLAKVLKGKRRIRSYGIFYKIVVEEVVHVCEVCASPVVRLSPDEWFAWCETGFMPAELKLALDGVGIELKSIIGNNFLEGGCGKKPVEAYNQFILPAFEAAVGRKYRQMFEMGS